jgi:hypothetical protein
VKPPAGVDIAPIDIWVDDGGGKPPVYAGVLNCMV